MTYTIVGPATSAKDGYTSAESPTGMCKNSGTSWSCTVPAGGSVTVTAHPNVAYDVVGLTCGTVSSSTPVLTVPNIQSNFECSARYKIAQFMIAYGSEPAFAGAVTGGRSAGPCSATPCVVNRGDSVTFKAAESVGSFLFDGWTGCSSSRTPEITLTNVSGNQTCTAKYRPAIF
jgi:hypothetical protein